MSSINIRFGILAAAMLAAGCTSTKSKVSVDYYAISGNSTRALDREIKRKGPKIDGGRHAVAVARIRMTPNLKFVPQGTNNCRVSQAKVAVNAKVTLPRWTGRRGASAKLGKAWDNIDRYTRLHEGVHVAIAFRFAKDMETKILALSGTGTCNKVRQKAYSIVERDLMAHDKAQKDFDRNEQKRFSMLAKRQTKRG